MNGQLTDLVEVQDVALILSYGQDTNIHLPVSVHLPTLLILMLMRALNGEASHAIMKRLSIVNEGTPGFEPGTC